LGDKVSAELKGSVNTAIEDAKKALESDDQDKMKAAFAELEKVSHKVSEEAYKRAAAEGAGAEAGAANGAESKPASDKDDVVDADYEEVRDNK